MLQGSTTSKPGDAGSARGDKGGKEGSEAGAPATPSRPLTGSEIRALILAGLEKASKPTKPLSAGKSRLFITYFPSTILIVSFMLGMFNTATSPLSPYLTLEHDYDLLLQPYASLIPKERVPELSLPGLGELKAEMGSKAGSVKRDEWEGLF